eukprot:TRINITY_DN18119_c0_g1_i1.p1 TRINITY_DN18119_c0_g1~~TRINITY_DN18119_c0_g1_i1.p1  ORF type:complete len:641 (+),score=106.76 TRINITY_DN18119_c0_g1_i1:168-1925(+)
MTSVHTQLPYGYYTLPYCRPSAIEDARENLGEHLAGDLIENSRYVLTMMDEVPCSVLCETNLTREDVNLFRKRIQQEYRVHWIVDNLPSATITDPDQEIYEAGFPVGEITEDKELYFLNNHVAITIYYHQDPALYTGYRIVRFAVKASSIAHSPDYNRDDPTSYPKTCPLPKSPETHPTPLVLPANSNGTRVIFTYSVQWNASDIAWSSRWDVYLKMTNGQVHWFSIVNSLMIVLFLSSLVAVIMTKILRRDINRYKELEMTPDVEETGWKLVHGDVFRPPTNSMLLSVSVGAGIQTLIMVFITIIFAVLGFLSPANRGALMKTMVVLFAFMGLFAGYFAGKLYKSFKGKAWKKLTLLTAFLYPGIDFVIFFTLNALVKGQKSSGAVDWSVLLTLTGLWGGISVPLTFLGAFVGFQQVIPDPPVKVHQIPRQIPEQVWYLKPTFSILMGGILPFGAIFIELFFILTSIWQHQFYYMFGFLFIVFIILFITCAEITVVMCYFQLCAEDYDWWWRSFLTAGASALYVFLYSVFYFFTKLQIYSVVSTLLYFGYTFIMSLHFFLLTGAIGFYACYYFVSIIYKYIKAD